MLIIRPASLADLPAITEIYNEAVLTTTATFDTNPKSEADRKEWFDDHDNRHPIVVAELEGVVIGWASLSRWSERLAYADTAEISLYVKSEYRGLGVGRQLISKIVEAGQRAELRTVIARIADGNEVSIHLHKAVGFEHIGVMCQVGRKFGRLLDVHLMQKIYP